MGLGMKELLMFLFLLLFISEMVGLFERMDALTAAMQGCHG